LLPRSERRRAGPDFRGSPTVDGQPRVTENVGVRRRGTERRLPVGVQLPLEQSLRQHCRVWVPRHTGCMMKIAEALPDVGHAAGGVVRGARGILETGERVLAEAGDLASEACSEEVRDGVDEIVNPACVVVHRPVVDETTRVDHLPDGVAELAEVDGHAPGPGRLYLQTTAQELIVVGMSDEGLDKAALSSPSR